MKRICTLTLIIFFLNSVYAQNLSVLAGSNNNSVGQVSYPSGPSYDFGGDGGLATNAQISDIQDMCYDANGNVYVSDYSNHRIRKINSAGVISTIAGNGSAIDNGDGGLAVNASISYPSKMYVNGNYLAVICANGTRVRMINLQTGIISFKAIYPINYYYTAICCDVSGTIFVGCNGSILKITPSNVLSTYAGGGANSFYDNILLLNTTVASTSVKFNEISSLTLNNNNGDLYLVDRVRDTNARAFLPDVISKITTSGVLSRFAGTKGSATASNNYTYFSQNCM